MKKYEYVLISYMHKTTGRIIYLFLMYVLIAGFYFSMDELWLCGLLVFVMVLLTFQAYLFKFITVAHRNIFIQSVFESDVVTDLIDIKDARRVGLMGISKVTLSNGKFYYFMGSNESVKALNSLEGL